MGLFNFFRRDTKKKNAISEEPDTPLPFGVKMSWLVLKEKNPHVVMETLGVNDIKVCNWNSAFSCMRELNQIFVTPCFNDYVVVLNYDLPLENEEILQEIALKFEEIQYFSTYRVVDLSCWVKFINGKLVRSFHYVGDQGEIYWNEGELTQEEREVGLTSASFDFEEYNDDVVYPNEDVVDEIAAKWGVDPFLTAYQETKSTGFLCSL